MTAWHWRVCWSKQKLNYSMTSVLMITVVQGSGMYAGVNKACAKCAGGNSDNDMSVGELKLSLSSNCNCIDNNND